MPDLELLNANFKFICSGAEPVFGVLWIPGWQIKDPIPVFPRTGQENSIYALYLAGNKFKFSSEDWS